MTIQSFLIAMWIIIIATVIVYLTYIILKNEREYEKKRQFKALHSYIFGLEEELIHMQKIEDFKTQNQNQLMVESEIWEIKSSEITKLKHGGNIYAKPTRKKQTKRDKPKPKPNTNRGERRR